MQPTTFAVRFTFSKRRLSFSFFFFLFFFDLSLSLSLFFSFSFFFDFGAPKGSDASNEIGAILELASATCPPRAKNAPLPIRRFFFRQWQRCEPVVAKRLPEGVCPRNVFFLFFCYSLSFYRRRKGTPPVEATPGVDFLRGRRHHQKTGPAVKHFR